MCPVVSASSPPYLSQASHMRIKTVKIGGLHFPATSSLSSAMTPPTIATKLIALVRVKRSPNTRTPMMVMTAVPRADQTA